MPPKAKFTKVQITEAALEITKQNGICGITARELGLRLGSSARPIFTIFQSMEEVQTEVLKAARTLYRQYVKKGLLYEMPFKGIGTQYIRFAIEEPKLFQLLFMTEQETVPDLSDVIAVIDENYEEILASLQMPYYLDKKTAQRLYRHMWIYTHGIAVLCATRVCRFDAAEVDEMLTEVFQGLLQKIKTEEMG